MSTIPQDLQYTQSHEWIKKNADSTLTIGITDYAQHMLGDLVYVDLPEVNRSVKQGEEVAVVESVKTAADVYSPSAGDIVEVNPLLKDSPDLVNQDPYGDGWLFRIKTKDAHLKNVLSPKEYEKIIDSN
jgi:glycine cleavage system H protein